MKNKLITITIVTLAILATWGAIYSSIQYQQAKASLLENAELREKIENKPRVVILQEKLEKNREMRAEIQSQIDIKLENKRNMADQADKIKEEIREELGL